MTVGIDRQNTENANIPGLSIARGQHRWMTHLNQSGRNLDVDIASTPESVWSVGGLYPFPASAQSLELVSSNVNDTSDGTGLQSARIEGLDANWAPKTQTVGTNGTGAVALDGTWLRVNRISGVAVGSGGVNAGVVDVRVSGGGTVLGRIETGLGRSTNACFSTAVNQTALLLGLRGSLLAGAGTTNAADLALFVRDGATGQSWQFRFEFAIGLPSATVAAFEIPLVIGPRHDMDIRVLDVSNNNMAVVCTWTMGLSNDLITD